MNMPKSRRNNTASANESKAAKLLGQTQVKRGGASDGLFFVFRIVVLVVACALAIMGLVSLTSVTDQQVNSLTVTTDSVRQAPMRNALLLCSNSDADASVSYQRNGVIDIMNRSSVSCDVEYLGAYHTSYSKESSQGFADYLRDKVSKVGGYNTVIAVGDDALSFMLDHYSDVASGAPVVFFGVNNQQLAERAIATGVMTGILQTDAVKGTLDAMGGLVPTNESLVVLTDGSISSEGLLAQFETCSTTGYPNGKAEVWDCSQMSRDALKSRLASLDSRSSILMLGAQTDSDGNGYLFSETTHFVADNTQASVFTAMGGVGEGICGSMFVDTEAEAKQAAETAVMLLNASNPASIPLSTYGPSGSVFDVSALEAHGLSVDKLPANATLVNEPFLSVRSIKPYLLPVGLLLVAAILIAIFGLVGYRRSRQASRAIIESRNDLRHRLYHDFLTDLPNRYALEQIVANKEASKNFKSMVQIDIDSFSDINDSYGHVFGNRIIQAVGDRLCEIDCLLLVRSGGDEFILAFDEVLTPGCLTILRIAGVFSDKVIIDDSPIELSARLGIANREPGTSAEALVVHSDLAMREAKRDRERVSVFYNEQMTDEVQRKLDITNCLKQAISDRDFTVLYQPQVTTDGCKVYGYEALVRLRGNIYYPSEFIPVAEMSGLVSEIDRIVTQQVIEQMGAWKKEGREVGVTSINFSAAQLKDTGYVDFLRDLMEANDIPASLIKIEFTESMLIGSEEEANKLFNQLLSMGITLALDDFGTGYSSLYRLTKSPVDFVKLDKSLVDAYMIPGKDGFIEHITKLIHGLNKRIVVEGVETYEQYEICLKHRCDVIQGYLFSRPVEAEEAIEFDAAKKLSEAKAAAGDKTRNSDWHKYDRDEHGRWRKKDKSSA